MTLSMSPPSGTLSSEVVDREGTARHTTARGEDAMAEQLSISRKQLYTGEPRASHSTHADRMAKHAVEQQSGHEWPVFVGDGHCDIRTRPPRRKRR